jgi:peptidoglycan/LPS O-acetylase OafA/YrhL
LVGRGSHEIYLFHMFVVFALIDAFELLQPSIAGIPLWYLSMLLLSIGCGYVIFSLYSEPLNKRFRTLGLWNRPKRSSAPRSKSSTSNDR